jgi:hypothetical protein
MKVGRIPRSVPRSADVSNDLTPLDGLTLFHAIRVPFQMGVVVAVLPRRIKLIDRETASVAYEELRDPSIFNGTNRCVPRSEDVDRLM